MKWRFTVRRLLVATAVVAAILGVAVATNRRGIGPSGVDLAGGRSGVTLGDVGQASCYAGRRCVSICESL